MRKLFSTKWNSSKQPRKQRKFVVNAPLHLRKKFLVAPLSKELKLKHKKRNLLVKKGDMVKILRGQFKKKEGKVEKVSRKKLRLFIEGINLNKKDGTKVPYPVAASNVILVELELDDKKRMKKSLKVKSK